MSAARIILDRGIPALDAAADDLCRDLRSLLRSGPPTLSAAKLFAIELVAREALQNALDHGCGAEASKSLRFCAAIQDGELSLSVFDDGPGFDSTAAIASSLAHSPPGLAGNGIRLISALADRFEYRDGGRTLIAYFTNMEESHMVNDSSIGLWAPQLDLVAAKVQRAKEELRTLVAASSGDFVMDLSAVTMIDSKGLGILIAAINTLESAGRALRVRGAGHDLVELFKIMSLDRHMTIC